MTCTTSERAAWLSDVRRILKIFEAIPGLPVPHISKYRASFHFTFIASKDEAAEAVLNAAAILGHALSVRFTPAWTECGSSRHCLLEASLPSGLTVCLVAKAEHVDPRDFPVDGEDAPVLAGVA